MALAPEKPDSSSLGGETAGFVLLDVGLSDYDTAYAKQLELVERKKQQADSYDFLLLAEHPEVYTFGRKSKEAPPSDLAKAVQIERGGEATYHNPGQLVAYPILSLRAGERDVHLHLRRLEQAVIDVLHDFNVVGESRNGETGVWIVGKQKKIASIGIAVSSWITYHGIALNVDNDLSGFSRIHPCGYSSDVMTSLQSELGDVCPTMGEVKEAFLRAFCAQFERHLLV